MVYLHHGHRRPGFLLVEPWGNYGYMHGFYEIYGLHC